MVIHQDGRMTLVIHATSMLIDRADIS